MTQKPSLDIGVVVGGAMIITSTLLLLVILHISILTVEAQSVKDSLTSVYVSGLNIFVALCILGVAGLIIQFLRYLVYMITVPKSERQRS